MTLPPTCEACFYTGACSAKVGGRVTLPPPHQFLIGMFLSLAYARLRGW